MIAANDYVDPMLPRMSDVQLRLLIAQAAGLLAHRSGGLAVREILDYVGKALSPEHQEAMRDIARGVAAEHGVTLAELRSNARHRHIARPRLKAYAKIYATGRFSLPTIAQFFHREDHTTVLKGIRSYERLKLAGRFS